MRRIGTFEDGSVARRFRDYLLTLDIDSAVDGGETGTPWDIWIRNEEDVERAKQEWSKFQQAPDAPQYNVEAAAARIRDQRVARGQQQIAKHRSPGRSLPPGERASGGDSPVTLQGTSQVTSRGAVRGTPSRSQPRQQNIPVTIAIIAISVVASLTSHFGEPRGIRGSNKSTLEQKTFDAMSFVDRSDYAASGDAFASIKRGQWWRFITPMFLHGDPFHLVFNMLWIALLGSAIERLNGSFFLLGLVLITQTAGMMLQVMLPDTGFLPETLRGSPFAIGASGAVYGLFGFLWIRPYIDPGYPIHMVPANVVLMLGWLVFCLTPMAGNVANGAHIGGLVSGMLLSVVGPMMRR